MAVCSLYVVDTSCSLGGNKTSAGSNLLIKYLEVAVP